MSLIGSISRWYWSFYMHRKPRPLITHLVLTNICNYRCTFCYVNADEKRYTMPLEQFKPLIRDLHALGTCYLYISGGEPLLVKNIEDYIVWAKKHIPYVHIVTNGSLLDQNMAKLLNRCKINEVSLSLDAMEKTHNLHRGSDKAFSNLLQAVENLKAHAPRITTTCTTILGPWNMGEQEELHRLCASLGVRQRYQGFQEYPSVLQRQNGATLLTKEFLGAAPGLSCHPSCPGPRPVYVAAGAVLCAPAGHGGAEAPHILRSLPFAVLLCQYPRLGRSVPLLWRKIRHVSGHGLS